jgi:hypothetical protein
MPSGTRVSWIKRLTGLVVALVASAVAIGVDHQRRPALRRRGIAGLPEFSRVDPADHRKLALGVGAEPKCVLGILGEIQVLGAEAGVDEGVFFRAWIKDRDLPRILKETFMRFSQRMELRRTQRRVLPQYAGCALGGRDCAVK